MIIGNMVGVIWQFEFQRSVLIDNHCYRSNNIDKHYWYYMITITQIITIGLDTCVIRDSCTTLRRLPLFTPRMIFAIVIIMIMIIIITVIVGDEGNTATDNENKDNMDNYNNNDINSNEDNVSINNNNNS